jgi:hypothetical protein
MPRRTFAAQLLCTLALGLNLLGSRPPSEEARVRLPEAPQVFSLQLPFGFGPGRASSPRPANRRHPRVPVKCGIGSDPNGTPCP